MRRRVIIEKYELNATKKYYFDGATEFETHWKNDRGVYHRLNGNPALIENSGLASWYIDGVLIDQENTKSIDEQIQEIMEEFDFENVHQAMIKLNWEWAFKGIPDVAELRRTALDLLQSSAKGGWNSVEPYGAATGGFQAECTKYCMRLSFVLNEWCTI